MDYYTRIRELTKCVPSTLVDFNKPRSTGRTPTQASSNFITNKEQGDWAENLVMRAVNETFGNFVAVKYGKSDDLVAGEDGFDDFYTDFQRELDAIGKRPDILIFKKNDFCDELGLDISKLPHEQITEYVKKSIAGIEVRSSAFLIETYEKFMAEKVEKFTQKALQIRDDILQKYEDLLQHPVRSKYIDILKGINRESITAMKIVGPRWGSSKDLVVVANLFRELNSCIKEVQKRDNLSITPKVEDIKVVYKWIETFGVPHFYFQVFFDKIYGISFEDILTIIADSEKEGVIYSVESDVKNQNKTTIKINAKHGRQIAYKVEEPSHESARKEMGRGRLLFYVTFGNGKAYLDINNLKNVLNVEDIF